ncbi:fatty acid synthase S-acetyltransferase [Aspergillus tubingensis]|nr:fatty acid synthase S-acetyltransferase [Aspergillus tubingensis]GFN20575.1 fatty acid synthase S-acetyltransferase [Aspergillus tubingensis]
MLRRRVCDACHARKVRCDKEDPCGNCQDQMTACTRTRGMKRLPKREAGQRRTREISSPRNGALVAQSSIAGRRSRQVSAELSSERFMFNDLSPHMHHDVLNMLDDRYSAFLRRTDMDHELPGWMSLVPLTDSQMIKPPQSGQSMDIIRDRHQTLEFALFIASQLLGGNNQCTGMLFEETINEDLRKFPSIELLYWMLNDIGTNKFGSYVQDYFRHISKETLKHMGLSILLGTATPPEALLYTVCVNSVAYKFLNTIASIERDGLLAQSLRNSALLYRETAQRCLRRIPLFTESSLSLLQTILCGIFLYQGSGDASTCQELTKTACRVCMDIGLYPGAIDLHDSSEEEYYCFMWCYILDRNYAWKLGRPRMLTVESDLRVDLVTSKATISTLFLIYLKLAKVQDTMIPFLVNCSIGDNTVCRSFTSTGAQLLRDMDAIRRNIDEIKTPSPHWTGLDINSEIATLNFSYHSIMTSILYLHQIAPGQATIETCLTSARQELQALITICESSDTQKTVAYLHWTLLYYPITACFALFCNAVATCHSGDFQILKAVANCLAHSGTMSQPIATMQNLFQQFVALSKCFFADESLSVDIPEGEMSTLQSQMQLGFQPLDGGIPDYSQVQLQSPSGFDSSFTHGALTGSIDEAVESVDFSSPLHILQVRDDLYDNFLISNQPGPE